jgi:ribosomal protein S18 acetylase RimI-like enzyme
MDQVLIRACARQDIDAIVQLEQQWEREDIAYGDFNPIDQEAFIAILERFPTYFLVAKCGEQLVGYIHGSIQRNKPVEVIPEQEPYLEVENIYVKPDFRNEDIGGKLLERLFDIASSDGIQRFLVSTSSKETDKILRFYRSHGFTPWYIQFFK